MSIESIRFAFAVNDDGFFQPTHFGNADRYLIYQWNNKGLEYLKDLKNIHKSLDEKQKHGLQQKGNAIIDYLKEEGVKIIVSKQFGKNIKMVNRHFIPIIIYKEMPDEVLPLIKKHMKWIEDELKNNPAEYRLFTFKKGALKTIIKKEE